MTRSFTLKSRRSEVTLRVCGVIDLCGGALLLVLGLALSISGTGSGAVCLALSPVVLWAGIVLTFGGVYASSGGVFVAAMRPHRAKYGDIAAIDIRRSDFGQIRQVVPFVTGKDGTAFKLLPLVVSSGQRIAKDADKRRELLAQQQQFVEELRSLARVSGSNYDGE